MNSLKKITFQRAVQFLRTKKAVDIYSKITNKSYVFRDVLTGPQHWCDFDDGICWGEYTSCFQSDEEAKYIQQQLYYINSQRLAEVHKVEVDENSLPQRGNSKRRWYSVNTIEGIEKAARKKLQKLYPYKENNFSSKGILLIGIVDPVFGGFKTDVEVTEYELNKIAQKLRPCMDQSCFEKIVIIDELERLENTDQAFHSLI
jgi:hypothetical protein